MYNICSCDNCSYGIKMLTLNITLTLTLILILIVTLPWTKNIITFTLTLCCWRYIITGAIGAGANVRSPRFEIYFIEFRWHPHALCLEWSSGSKVIKMCFQFVRRDDFLIEIKRNWSKPVECPCRLPDSSSHQSWGWRCPGRPGHASRHAHSSGCTPLKWSMGATYMYKWWINTSYVTSKQF